MQRLCEHVDAKPGEYSEQDASAYFWHNGAYPESAEDRALFDGKFADYRLQVHGLVENPVEQVSFAVALDVLAHSLPGDVLHRTSLTLGTGTQSRRSGFGQTESHGHAFMVARVTQKARDRANALKHLNGWGGA